jgi:hypothetical protein
MTPTQRISFEKDVFDITYPAADALLYNVMPDNNHRLVSLSAYGLLGIITGNQTMVNLVQSCIDHFLTNFIRAEGACFMEKFLVILPFIH